MIPRFSLLPAALGTLAAALLVSCASGAESGEPDPELGMRVQWLTGDPSATLPDALTTLTIKLFRDADSDVFEETTVSRMGFQMDGDRTFVSPPLLSNLPVGTPFEIVIEGYEGTRFGWIGQVGPLVLGHGERRFVDLKMYETNRSIVLSPADMPGRFLHTSTALPDGRVLIAGGFDGVENMAECPDGTAAEARCFSLVASRDAFVFDPTSGRFHRLRETMLQARAGHTATLLPGGRVLLAGGASAGLLVLTPIGDPDAPRGYAPGLAPLVGEEVASHATFEVFLPNENAEGTDDDRDGDPGRGGFTGSASAPTLPGRLNAQRFAHAAAVVPGAPERVMLVGGFGAAEESGAGSWEIYDDQKPGGFGVYDGSGNNLTSARIAPGAVALTVPEPEGRIWIFGGSVALDNSDLAEIWEPVEGDPNGAVQVATETPFPNDVATDETPRPEYSLIAPSVAAVGGGTHALVGGWLGPRCMPGDTTPVFPDMPDASGTELCGHTGDTRSFAVDGMTGVTRKAVIAGSHAFGAMTTLDDGTVVWSGGIQSIVWNRESMIELFTGEVEGGVPARGPQFMLQTPRVFHRAAALPQTGVLHTGGMTLSTDARNASLVSTAEVLYPPRMPLTLPSGGGVDAGM